MLVAGYPSEGRREVVSTLLSGFTNARGCFSNSITLTQVFLPVLFNTSANGHLSMQSFLVSHAAKLAFEFISLRVSAGTAYCS
jgi:hypothetical protein